MNSVKKDIERRTFDFSVRVIKMVNQSPQCTAAFELGRQVIRSATSINSNIVHAQSSLTRKEFIYYLNNAKKEAKETKRWIEMIVAVELLTQDKARSLLEENEEIIKILVSSVKNAEKNS
ncbi:four helix bundle protein [Patescibacteria group bacterium]|nr:four helix bundle protein [Patescibacteria group bacterium]MBU1922340.1 four helix bundle protein [Patescibacteria group bacterium]